MDSDTSMQQDHDMEPVAVTSSLWETLNHQPLNHGNLVLENPEILQSIFEQFYDQNEDHGSRSQVQTRKFLLSASLTCRAFFEPAMDAMWRYLDSLLPILRVIPTLKRGGNGHYVRLHRIQRVWISKLHASADLGRSDLRLTP